MNKQVDDETTWYSIGHAKLAWWLEQKELPCRWMGERLGVPATTVWRWCSGERVPEAHYRLAIATITHGEVNQFDWMTPVQLKVAFVYRSRKLSAVMEKRKTDSLHLQENNRSI